MILSTVLLVLTLVTGISWIANVILGRRHLYAAARKVQGPLYIPFFGISFGLLGHPWDFLDILNGYFKRFPGLVAMWFGNQLIWGIDRPDYVETVLNNPNCYSKWTYMYRSIEAFAGQGLISVRDLSVWKRHRKILNPAFSQRILNEFMKVFVGNCTLLMKNLKQFDGKGEFDIHEAIYKCNLDVVCESMMGVKVHAQASNSTYHHVFERLLDIALLRMINIGYHMDWYYKRTKLHQENVELLRVLNDFTNNVIKTKKEKHENKSKHIDGQIEVVSEDYIKSKALSDLLIEEESLTETEIKDEVNTFIMAGADTSTGTTGFVLLMLAMHPDIQNKVLEETLSVVGPDRNIEPSDLPHLKYLECCVKESLRLFPSVCFIFRQVDGDIKLNNETTLPKGSGILIGIMSLHRSATYWPNPLKFDPDRFLPENVAARHPYAFIPFSGGPRNCIGFKFALMTMKAMVATIVREYKLTTSYKTVSDVELKANIVLKTKNGVNISLQHR